MVFSSTLFLTMFLPIVLGIYFLAQEKLRNMVLLIASLLFYAWGEPKAVWIMVALIILSYFVGVGIEKYPKYARGILSLGIIANLSALIFYKYWMFLLGNINLLSGWFHFEPFKIPAIALPIGISFYVFQIMSYLIDVYRGGVSVQKNFICLATYVSLFPQLVAGPIVRYETIQQDIRNRATNFENVYWGLRRFVIGLAKKVLIADQMAFVADIIFKTPVQSIPVLFAWVGALTYTLQIYYDFSGYSDMAIGLGRMFNFRFLENFNYPYISRSISEYWRRWHISLGSWFRDYIFLPLSRALSLSKTYGKLSRAIGRKKANITLTVIALFVVWFATGLWHGAAWTFIVWGLYNGFFILIETLTGWSKPRKSYLGRGVQHTYCVLAFIVGFVIFRADTLTYAWEYIKVMFGAKDAPPLDTFYKATEFLTYSNVLIFVVGWLLATPVVAQWYRNHVGTKTDAFVIVLLFVAAYVFAITSTFSPFIYFRF